MQGRIVVRAPASSANLGPGLDCLGLALGLYHRLTVSVEDGAGLRIEVTGEGAAELPTDGSNAVYRALRRAAGGASAPGGLLHLRSHSDIPLAGGLGSSAAALVAGMAAGLLLSGQELDPQRLIDLAAEDEPHPDNIVPCVLGGFTVAVATGSGTRCVRLEPPSGLGVVVAVPDFRVRTRESRRVLPACVELGDAVANLGRVGMLTAALATGQLELLAVATEDRLHQPYRAGLVPGLEDVREAALQAGAAGAALSGSGPTMLAFITGDPDGVGRAMQAAWLRHGVAARVLTPAVDRRGLTAGLEE